MNVFSKLFASFDTQDSLVFLIFLLVAFLIGYLLSWVVGSRRTARAREEAQKAGAELKALDAEYQSFKEQFALREADLQHAQIESEDHKRQTHRLQEEKKRLLAELEEMQIELKRLESSVTSQQVTIEDLNDQILGLRTKNQQLLAEGPAAPQTPAATPETPAGEDVLSALNAALQRLAAVEERLDKLASEREVHASLEQLFEVEDEEEADEEALVRQAREYVHAAISPALPSQKDELQQIQGIGPFIEKQLNDLGIYTYAQIAGLEEPMIEQLTTAIQFFPGRIVKDDWAGQAARLLANAPEKPVEAPLAELPEETADFDIADIEHDPLQKIEGIGPKIESLLVQAGIRTFHHVADAGVVRLQEVLSNAGERFRLHDPSTWPEQARLAAAGKWEELERYKEFLNGGEYK
ncbi:MAG: helix-hairpin-helix domain-containing protein [Saprospiraceae bacterium]